MEIVLTRYYMPEATYGALTGDNGMNIVTIEQPWKQNKSFESCVPEGEYHVIRDVRPSRGRTFCLINEELNVAKYPTPGMRDSILIHVGNFVEDIQGCIAPGKKIAPIGSELAVWSSRDAWRTLDRYVGEREEFKLIIRQYRPAQWRT